MNKFTDNARQFTMDGGVSLYDYKEEVRGGWGELKGVEGWDGNGGAGEGGGTASTTQGAGGPVTHLCVCVTSFDSVGGWAVGGVAALGSRWAGCCAEVLRCMSAARHRLPGHTFL